LLQNHRRFVRLLRKEQYDVVHLNIFHGLSLYYAVLAKREGIPVRIAHSHNTALRRSFTRPLKQVIHEIAKERYTNAATDLWSCSKPAAQFLFPKKALETKGYRLIPNCIDIRWFQFDPLIRETSRKELGVEDQFVIGSIGRLCYQKNQSFLLKIFQEVHKQQAKSCLLLVGDGEDRTRLEKQAARLGIADKVLFYGVCDHVERLLWAMDAFVLPSRFEGAPVTSIEAQSAGLPCLFSDAITKECQIGKSVSFLSLDASPQKWAQAVLQMKAIGNRAESAAAVYAAGFDAAYVSKQIEDFYRKAGAHRTLLDGT